MAALILVPTAHAADARAGKAVFADQCGLCHSAEPGDNGGGMGPSLRGLVGKPAASLDQYPYSAALKAAKLTWDQATLDRFLADPAKAAPGSPMSVSVADKTQREDLVAYLLSIKPAVSP